MKKLKIEIYRWWANCADGCCTTCGTDTKVNGVIVSEDDDPLYDILKHLGYEAEIIKNYNDKED